MKEDINNYLLKSSELLELYNLETKNLHQSILQFPSEDPNSLNFYEFLDFLNGKKISNQSEIFESPVKVKSALKDREKEPNKELKVIFSIEEKENTIQTEKPKAQTQNNCMLNENTINLIKEIFYEIDKYEDLIVKRQVFVQKLREDVRLKRTLKEPAVHIVDLSKYLSLEKLLNQIEEEETRASGDQKRAREYISLKQFLKYFTDYETPSFNLLGNVGENKRQITDNEIKLKENDQEDEIIELCEENINFFEGVFKEMSNNGKETVETIFLIDKIRGDERYKIFKKDLARSSPGSLDIGCETIEEVINRLEMEAEKFIQWEEFLAFFTIRGRPEYLKINF